RVEPVSAAAVRRLWQLSLCVVHVAGVALLLGSTVFEAEFVDGHLQPVHRRLVEGLVVPSATVGDQASVVVALRRAVAGTIVFFGCLTTGSKPQRRRGGRCGDQHALLHVTSHARWIANHCSAGASGLLTG